MHPIPSECPICGGELIITSLDCGDCETRIEGRFTKICVSVDSEEELLEIYNKARSLKLNTSLITDAGLTEFHGEPTKTAVAVGPGKPEVVDKVTGNLKLL